MRHLPGGEDGEDRDAAPAEGPGGRGPAAKRREGPRNRPDQRVPVGTALEGRVNEHVEEDRQERQPAGQGVDEQGEHPGPHRRQPDPADERRRRGEASRRQRAPPRPAHAGVVIPFDPVVQGAGAPAGHRDAEKQEEEPAPAEELRGRQQESSRRRQCDDQRDLGLREFEVGSKGHVVALRPQRWVARTASTEPAMSSAPMTACEVFTPTCRLLGWSIPASSRVTK